MWILEILTSGCASSMFLTVAVDCRPKTEDQENTNFSSVNTVNFMSQENVVVAMSEDSDDFLSSSTHLLQA